MILVTGATGFVGGHLVRRLRGAGLPLRALVRPGSPSEYLARRGIEVAVGDVTQPRTLVAATDVVETVIHLVGLLREPPGVTFESVVSEGTRALVAAATEAGVKRFVYLSAIGTSPSAGSRYHRTKWQAEQAVRGFAGEHVILRASVIFGPGDDFVTLFARLPLPVPGPAVMVQPIWIDDVCQIIHTAATSENPDIVGATHEIGGPRATSLRDLCLDLERAQGRGELAARLRHPPLPLWLAGALASGFELLRLPLGWLGTTPPLSRDQVLMLETDNVCDTAPMQQHFGLDPLPFDEGVRRVVSAPAE